jgi:hypothetical protein
MGWGTGPASTGKPWGEPLAISRTTSWDDGAGEGGALEVQVRRDARHGGAQVGSSPPPGVGRAPRGRAVAVVLVPRAGKGVSRGALPGPQGLRPYRCRFASLWASISVRLNLSCSKASSRSRSTRRQWRSAARLFGSSSHLSISNTSPSMASSRASNLSSSVAWTFVSSNAKRVRSFRYGRGTSPVNGTGLRRPEAMGEARLVVRQLRPQ